MLIDSWPDHPLRKLHTKTSMTGIINFSLSSKISPVSFAQFEPSAPAQTDIFKPLVFSSISSRLHVMYQHTQGASQSTPINIPRPSQNSCKQPIKLQNGLNGPYVSPWGGGSECPHGPSHTGEVQFSSYLLTTLINIVKKKICMSIKQFNQMCDSCAK